MGSKIESWNGSKIPLGNGGGGVVVGDVGEVVNRKKGGSSVGVLVGKDVDVDLKVAVGVIVGCA